jgi:uncharacterized protein
MISFLKSSLVVVALIALATSPVHRARAERVQDLPRPQNYVSDFAGALSPQTAAALDQLCSAVDHQAHAQIAVVTIKTLDDVPIEDFATQLEEKWGVGPKKNDRGILIILATQDHKRRIEVGYGLEGVITDQQAGEIGRAMVPDLRAGSYDGAVTLAVTQIANKVAAAAGVTLQAPLRGPPRGQGRPMTLGQLLWIGGIFLLLLFLVARTGGSGLVGFLLGMFLGGGGGGGGGDDEGGGGFGGFGGGSSGGGGASGDW